MLVAFASKLPCTINGKGAVLVKPAVLPNGRIVNIDIVGSHVGLTIIKSDVKVFAQIVFYTKPERHIPVSTFPTVFNIFANIGVGCALSKIVIQIIVSADVETLIIEFGNRTV